LETTGDFEALINTIKQGKWNGHTLRDSLLRMIVEEIRDGNRTR